MNKDEFKSFEPFGDDYTIKIYEREDCRYYAIVVYETAEESKVIYSSKAMLKSEQARKLAYDYAVKHESEKKKMNK